MKVLVVVEDDEAMRMLIRLTLVNEPSLQVMESEAATAEEAVEEATRVQPDLVVLDHFIKGEIMGLEAAPLIKAAAPDCKIILFSSHDLAVESERSDAVDAFVSKSTMAKLIPTARELLGV